MKDTLGKSPGSVKYPDHRIRIQESTQRFTAELDGDRIADSRDALLLQETGYEPVVYFPPQHVDVAKLQRSDSRTTCPFKGQADYFAAVVEGRTTDIAWTYPSTYDDVASIEGFVAFYADRVAITALPEPNDG